MRTLVTGGAGFIGTHLVRALVERGDEVVVLDSLEEQVHGDTQPDLPAGVELIVGNVGDREPRRRARWTGVERVVHLAAAVGVGQSMYEIARYTELNTMATARFLEHVVAQRPMPVRMVVASSMSIYGEGEYVCDEHGRVAPGPAARGAAARPRVGDAPARLRARAQAASARSEAKPLIPTSIYAINKRDHEEMCLVTGAAYGIPTVALRFFNVYGPGQALSNPYTGVAAIFASRLLNGRPPIIFEDGEQSRDFTHVSDIVARHPARARVRRRAVGHAINLGTGRPTTVAQVAAGHLGRDGPRRSSPSSTSSTAPATSATASPTRPAHASCSASRRRRPSRTAWRARRVAAGPGGRRPRRRRHPGAGRPRPGPLRAERPP